MVAAVILKENTNVSANMIINFCRESLAGYKIPKIIKFVTNLPYTASGKIIRAKVKELF